MSTIANPPDVSDEVKDQTADTVFNTPINSTSLLTYATEAMQLIENLPKFSGAQKLEVLSAVVSEIISSSNLPAEEKVALNALVTALIPTFASVLVMASKGFLDLNKAVSKCCVEGKCCIT